MKLETFKTFIEINLTNGFIRPSKSLIKIPILLKSQMAVFPYVWITEA